MVTAFHDEGDHPGAVGQDALGNLVIGMAFQFGMVDAFDGVVSLKALSQRVGILANSGHPHVQRSHAAFKQVTRMWVGSCPEVDLSLENFSDEFLGAHDSTAQDIGVAAEVLGGGMNDEINAHVQRLAAPR